MFRRPFQQITPLVVGLTLLGCLPCSAQDTAASAVDSGHTSWILASTALVLFMTMPGLALFYGGLVRGKNLLSVMAQCAGIACMASLLWAAGLYSLAFKGDGGWIGNMDAAFLQGITAESVAPGTKLPETLFVMFQMTFAIITPGLYVGAVVERMKFGAMMLFSALWLAFVYTPVAHWVWGGGWLQDMGIRDLAGGIVVHATAGVSALVLAIMLGKRQTFPAHPHPPHNPGMVFVGAAMLWVGWFGFNAGSQLTAGGNAGMTMLVTHLSACSAAMLWCLLERLRNGKVGLVGMVTGLVAGLATITPASGDVGPMGAVAIGAIASVVCYFSVSLIREKLHIDDSLDVFAVHGVGGILGTLLLAFFGQPSLGGLGLVKSAAAQFGIQATGIGVAVLWSAAATALIALVVKATIGLRVTREQEYEGMDRSEHGENAYPMEP
ncbi:MAG TPA: ammonium transporter [Luteolibacter sp.]|nr:ammonium transporter [Luteolibacter sp.]